MPRQLTPALLIVLIAFFAVAAEQASADGNTLLEGCQDAVQFLDVDEVPKEGAFAGWCLGYLRGVSDTLKIARTKLDLNVCFPDGVGANQLVRVVFKYMKEHPELLHAHEMVLTLNAFSEAFPCSKSG